MDRTTVCPKCGTALRPAARFCDACGAAMAGSAHRAEYKQATILFVDVVRSMDIASRVGAERLREIMTDLVDRCVQIVTSYEGIVDAFTGDGVMALFGTPAALEDHAVRACLAALQIQRAASDLSTQLEQTDGIVLTLRVGINSGEVVAGESSVSAMGYTVTGEHVGMAQRMQSAAPPGGVLVSESTAGLVEHAFAMGDPEMVSIKGFPDKVPARTLLTPVSTRLGRRESSLVGRDGERDWLVGRLDQVADGGAALVGIVGPAGLGKSRLAREAAAAAAARDMNVTWSYCESHARAIPFHAGAGLLRELLGVAGLEPDVARSQLRSAFPSVDPADAALLEDLLAIGDPQAAVAEVSPDARRRRLRALVGAALSARTVPAVYVVEDIHWIDDLSEAVLVDIVEALAQTPALVLLTFRPEYRGPVAELPGLSTIVLGGLAETAMSELVAEALGPSAATLTDRICERAAGNPFFAEEIVRELVARGVLVGASGEYLCTGDTLDVSVPPTLHAAIAARVDRLGAVAKQTLYCASVIGSHFDAALVSSVLGGSELDALADLVDADLVAPLSPAEYAFSHPLIRSVAYSSQLRSERAVLHRQFAAAIEQRDPQSTERNAALIAEHLQAAGDNRISVDWHMRAGTWAVTRDMRAARMSWQRAVLIADALPDTLPESMALRIMPRAMLCATAWRVGLSVADGGLGELQQLAASTGDRMSGTLVTVLLAADHYRQCRFRDAAQLASEVIAGVDATTDADTAIRLLAGMMTFKIHAGDFGELYEIAQRVVDLTDGDPMRGHLGNSAVASPLAVAMMTRGVARATLGRGGWKDDLVQAVSIAEATDLTSHAMVASFVHGVAVSQGWLVPTANMLAEADEILRLAEQFGDDMPLGCAQVGRLVILMHLDGGASDDEIAAVRELAQRVGVGPWVPLIDILSARQMVLAGDTGSAVVQLQELVGELEAAGDAGWRSLATELLVEALLAEGRLVEARTTVEELTGLYAARGAVAYDPPILKLRALLARHEGDHDAERELARRYVERATELGFEGHMATAAREFE